MENKNKRRKVIFAVVIWSLIFAGFIVNDVEDYPEDAQEGFNEFIQPSIKD